jgi:hypothetical protein
MIAIFGMGHVILSKNVSTSDACKDSLHFLGGHVLGFPEKLEWYRVNYFKWSAGACA